MQITPREKDEPPLSMAAASVLLLLLPAPALAQEVDCAAATATVELSFCASQRLEAADAALNYAYEAAVAAARGYEGGQEALLREAQRAWIAFRDAACSAEGSLYEGGTMQPLVGTDCLVRLTDRAKDRGPLGLRRGGAMRSDPFAPWRAGFALWALAVQAQAVIGLRTLGMMGVLAASPRERRTMVAEKGPAFARAALAAGTAAAQGKGPDAVVAAAVRPLKRRTGANVRRLTRPRR
jgi:uncharacterized protein YecT (DUF1311 family)